MIGCCQGQIFPWAMAVYGDAFSCRIFLSSPHIYQLLITASLQCYTFTSTIIPQKEKHIPQNKPIMGRLGQFRITNYYDLFGACQFIQHKQMQQEQLSWPQILNDADSNHGQYGEFAEIYNQAVFSVIKHQSLISLLYRHDPNTRSEKDCKAIAEYLKTEPYFQEIAKNNKTLLDVSSWIECEKIEEGNYIYRIHEVADCLYILLSGEVHLTYPEKQVLQAQVQAVEQVSSNQNSKNLKEELFYPTSVPALTKNHSLISPSPTEPSKSVKRLTRHLSLLTEELQIEEIPPKKIAFEERVVQIVSRGECFGDLGDSNRRGTNAIAKQTCYVLIIRKQHYGVLSNAQVKSQNHVKFSMLSSLPLFQLLYRYSQQSIIYLLEDVKVGYNNIVYNQNDSIKFIYIVYKGEFKLYKKIRSRKDNDGSALNNSELRVLTKNVTFKSIQPGQILGYTQSYNKVNKYQQTCVCKSQQGIILKIDKNKFMKKILSPDNNLEDIISYIKDKSQTKNRQISQFIKKHQNDSLLIRYLHTPSAKPRRVNTQSSSYKNHSQRKDELRRMSTAKDNFFQELNCTIKHQVKSTRISIKRCIKANQQRVIPNCIKDIIGIVSQQTNYYKIRKPKQNITLFQFNISKVPIHVKKKYQGLFKKQNRLT